VAPSPGTGLVARMRKGPLTKGTLRTHASEARIAEVRCAAMEVGERRQFLGDGTAGALLTQSISPDLKGRG
jgi:hypothetical protein